MKKIKYIITILLSLTIAGSAWAAMQSDSYVIYENVMHSFDGPVISGVSAAVSGVEATVVWSTDVASDSFVIYDTDSSFTGSKEQGTSVKNYVSHSVILSGLAANTTYYYRARSERVNGGITTDIAARSFTTGAADDGEEEAPSGGGGILIIDKTDKAPPVITKVAVNNITSESAAISWETDEDATSFIEYGRDANYGFTYGQWGSSTAHTVILENLSLNTVYHFRALSSDDYGNVGRSDDYAFITALSAGEEGEILDEESIPLEIPESEEESEESILARASQRVLEILGKLLPEVSLNALGPALSGDISAIGDLSSLIPAPILSGEPRVEIGATEAAVFWTSDVEANSFVAVAPDDEYRPDANEPYMQVVGDAENFTINHEVKIYGLKPDTDYHYQLRSASQFGSMSKSKDFTFKTKTEDFEIISFFTKIIDNETAEFKWITNKEGDSTARFAPYHNNVLALDQVKIVKDNAMSVIHEITIAEFEAGTVYEVELVSRDNRGNIASEILAHFSTSEDDLPPAISHIKTDSTIFLDRSDKIQTIISWLTNEPSTSMVYYQEGVHGGNKELSEKTGLNTNYTKEHVIVITKFKPGTVYSLRVESVDSGKNTSISKAHTFMTAKKKDSIIQVIINILENTFGWIKKIM